MKQIKRVLTLFLALTMLLSCSAAVFAVCAHANTEVRNAVAATCTADGYSGDTYCVDCGEKLATGAVIPSTGHHYDDGVVSKAATCTEDGERTYLCAACGSTYSIVIKASGHVFGEWTVTKPATATMKGEESHTCIVCGAVETREIKPLGYAICYAKYFSDCPDKWYHEAIDYVVHTGLMNGISTKKFDPQGIMTRAMIVTVLYRMEGSPDITALSSFKDVPRNEWYAEAIAWAQDTGIVEGYSTEKFGPNDPVTREQIATILWRYKGRPEAKDADMYLFSDVTKISQYAKVAMTWAVGEGILKGDSYRLKPRDNATRAEFACMIMRLEGGSYICESMKDWDDEEDTNVEGTYRLRSINGKSVKEYLLEKLGDQKTVNEYLKDYGISSYDAVVILTLKADGTFNATYLGLKCSGTWKRNGSKVTVTIGEEELEGNYSDGEITADMDGVLHGSTYEHYNDEIYRLLDGEWLLSK